MPAKKQPKRLTIRLTERQLYLLDNGFGTAYMPDDSDPDSRELIAISAILQRALERA